MMSQRVNAQTGPLRGLALGLPELCQSIPWPLACDGSYHLNWGFGLLDMAVVRAAAAG
jgi:hypothetical protein